MYKRDKLRYLMISMGSPVTDKFYCYPVYDQIRLRKIVSSAKRPEGKKIKKRIIKVVKEENKEQIDLNNNIEIEEKDSEMNLRSKPKRGGANLNIDMQQPSIEIQGNADIEGKPAEGLGFDIQALEKPNNPEEEKIDLPNKADIEIPTQNLDTINKKPADDNKLGFLPITENQDNNNLDLNVDINQPTINFGKNAVNPSDEADLDNDLKLRAKKKGKTNLEDDLPPKEELKESIEQEKPNENIENPNLGFNFGLNPDQLNQENNDLNNNQPEIKEEIKEPELNIEAKIPQEPGEFGLLENADNPQVLEPQEPKARFGIEMQQPIAEVNENYQNPEENPYLNMPKAQENIEASMPNVQGSGGEDIDVKNIQNLYEILKQPTSERLKLNKVEIPPEQGIDPATYKIDIQGALNSKYGQSVGSGFGEKLRAGNNKGRIEGNVNGDVSANPQKLEMEANPSNVGISANAQQEELKIQPGKHALTLYDILAPPTTASLGLNKVEIPPEQEIDPANYKINIQGALNSKYGQSEESGFEQTLRAGNKKGRIAGNVNGDLSANPQKLEMEANPPNVGISANVQQEELKIPEGKHALTLYDILAPPTTAPLGLNKVEIPPEQGIDPNQKSIDFSNSISARNKMQASLSGSQGVGIQGSLNAGYNTGGNFRFGVNA